MSLKAFLSSLANEEARKDFAASCETSLGHLRNCIYQGKPIAADTCVLIERASGGAAMRWALRPSDWHRIWPELMARPDAPIVIHQTVKPAAPRLARKSITTTRSEASHV